MDSLYRFLTFGKPWTQSMPLHDCQRDWLKLVGGVIMFYIMSSVMLASHCPDFDSRWTHDEGNLQHRE